MKKKRKYIMKVLETTALKARPVQSAKLEDSEKATVRTGDLMRVHSFRYDPETKHVKVAFLHDSFKGKNTWYAFADYVQILRDGKVLPWEQPQVPQSVPQSVSQGGVRLNVPYFSQLDNEYEPHGTCNVTSVAMCLAFLGEKPENPNRQLEDELFEYVVAQGWSRHSHSHLQQLARDYGYKDTFTVAAKWGDVKKHLEAGFPAINGGDYTDFGHIIVIVGYNDEGWIVHDPYGHWYEDGYDTNESGEFLVYSYGMMNEYAGIDGDLWIHYVSK